MRKLIDPSFLSAHRFVHRHLPSLPSATHHLPSLPSPISHLSPSTPLPSINPLRRWKYLPGMWYCWRTRNCIKHLTVVWARSNCILWRRTRPRRWSQVMTVMTSFLFQWQAEASFFILPILFFILCNFIYNGREFCLSQTSKKNEWIGPRGKRALGPVGRYTGKKNKNQKKNKVLTCTILTSKYGNHTLKSKWYM